MKLFSTLLLTLTLIASSAKAIDCEDTSITTDCATSCSIGCSTGCAIARNPYASIMQSLLNDLDAMNISFSDLVFQSRNDHYFPSKEEVTKRFYECYEACAALIKDNVSVDGDLESGYGSFREMINHSVEFFEGVKALELARICEVHSEKTYVQLYASILLKNLQKLIEKYQPEAKA